jgi:hypothetical protein
MRIEHELAVFLSSPVLQIIGTHDPAGRPDIGRGQGAMVDAAAGRVDVLFSRWLWPGTAANLTANGAIALTFARARDYAAYQIKGPATLIEPTDVHRRVARDYGGAIRAALTAQGVPPTLIETWLTDRDALVARVAVTEVFEQTPGPRAGRALGVSA